jgi:hypothetical protein
VVMVVILGWLPLLNIAGTHTGIFVDMTRLIKGVCSRIVYLYKELQHADETVCHL